MYKAIAYYNYERESWHIVIGRYETEWEAEKACYDYGNKHEMDIRLQYFQVLDDDRKGR